MDPLDRLLDEVVEQLDRPDDRAGDDDALVGHPTGLKVALAGDANDVAGDKRMLGSTRRIPACIVPTWTSLRSRCTRSGCAPPRAVRHVCPARTWPFAPGCASGHASEQSVTETSPPPTNVSAPFRCSRPAAVSASPPSTRSVRTKISLQFSKTSAASLEVARRIVDGPAPCTTMRLRPLIVIGADREIHDRPGSTARRRPPAALPAPP